MQALPLYITLCIGPFPFGLLCSSVLLSEWWSSHRGPRDISSVSAQKREKWMRVV